MEGSYPIYYAQKQAGNAQIVKCGMYLRVVCRCAVAQDLRCRLVLRSRDSSIDLGLFTADSNNQQISRQISIKQAGIPPYSFCLEEEYPFVPIYEKEPYVMIGMLENTRFAVRDGLPGIVIYKSISSPTGQWSEPNISL